MQPTSLMLWASWLVRRRKLVTQQHSFLPQKAQCEYIQDDNFWVARISTEYVQLVSQGCDVAIMFAKFHWGSACWQSGSDLRGLMPKSRVDESRKATAAGATCTKRLRLIIDVMLNENASVGLTRLLIASLTFKIFICIEQNK
eukprot:scaffold47406_cov47-Prasinocladus_malaysianus.AAC.1